MDPCRCQFAKAVSLTTPQFHRWESLPVSHGLIKTFFSAVLQSRQRWFFPRTICLVSCQWKRQKGYKVWKHLRKVEWTYGIISEKLIALSTMTIVKIYGSIFTPTTNIETQIPKFNTNVPIPAQSKELIALRSFLVTGTTVIIKKIKWKLISL